jgi:DNA-binding FadR family transcriptional regulator
VKTKPPGSSPSRRKIKLSESIAAQILDDIAARGMAEGQPLMSEAAMLETYNGGRASVREALRILETNGLITIKAGPKGGALVGSVDPVHFGRMSSRYFQLAGASIRELIEARLALEPATTGLAARRRDPEKMDELRAWLEASMAVREHDDEAYREDSLEFHAMIAGLSGNRVLDLLTMAMTDVFSSRVRRPVYPRNARRRVREAHEEIARHILEGDAEAAETSMRSHLEDYARHAATRLAGLLDDTVSWQ